MARRRQAGPRVGARYIVRPVGCTLDLKRVCVTQPAFLELIRVVGRPAAARARASKRRCCLLLQDLYEGCARRGCEERGRVLWDATSRGL